MTTRLNRDPDTGAITGLANGAPIHYGLWPEPITAGLVYYETYKASDGTYSYGMAGQYEGVKLDTLKTNKELKDGSLTVVKDGYALVFEGDNDVPVGEYEIKYGNTTQKEYTLERHADGMWKWKSEDPYIYVIIVTQNGRTYTLIPLPEEVVTDALPGGDVVGAKFYQNLVYSEGLFGEREFYFNPHFAKTVKAGTITDEGKYDKPPVPTNPNHTLKDIPAWAVMCWEIEEQWSEDGIDVIPVRTARHFYALSCFQNSYVHKDKRYYFKQELDLDYNTYDWYGNKQPTKVDNHYEQVPIGLGIVDSEGFKGAYNGGGYKLKNVFYSTNIVGSQYNVDPKSQYIGLFWYGEYLWDIHYEIQDDITVTVANNGQDYYDKDEGGSINNGGDGVKVGTLIGGDFRAWKCSATLKNLTVIVNNGKHTYVGSLVGGVTRDTSSSARIVSGCAVEIGDLRITGTVKEGYAGGLVGYNNNGGSSSLGSAGGLIYSSYAVGAIGFGNDIAENTYYAGLAGVNGGDNTIQYSYSAVGVPTGKGYNFCSNKTSRIEDCCYLTGSWTYNGQTYTALEETTSYAEGVSYEDLQKFTSDGFNYEFVFDMWGETRRFEYPVPEMKARDGISYPFPTSSTDKDSNWFCPGTDWPKNWQAAATNSLSLLSNDMEPRAR